MSQVLFQDVIDSCLGELMSRVEGGKTVVYTLLVANSTSSDILPLITTLDLSLSPGTKGNFSFFLANVLPMMTSLTSLDLSGHQIGDDGVRSLAASTSLSNLTTLELSNNQIRDDGAHSIAKSTNLTNLTSLSLNSNILGDVGARSIGESISLSNLTSLDLNNNRIGAPAARSVKESTSLSNLTTLYINDKRINKQKTH